MTREIGRKIVIVGISASGKSTLARKFADKLSVPLIHMDSIMWKPGWSYIGDDETMQKLDVASQGTEWIIEGYITKAARTFLFDRADKIIYLDYSRIRASWQYIKRCFKHRHDPRPELEGSPDEFSFKFLKLVWTKGEARTLDVFLNQVKDQSKIIKLYSAKAAEKLLNLL